MPQKCRANVIWLALVLVLTMVLNQGFQSQVYPEKISTFQTPKHMASDPTIELTGDGAVDAFCAGNGTDGLSWATAHVIENYQIDAASSGSALYLADTTRYLIIENCTLIGSGTNLFTKDAGLTAVNCSHLWIRNCTIRNNGRHGIFSAQCSDLTIEHTVISLNNQTGIYVSQMLTGLNISTNILESNGLDAIDVIEVEGGYIADNHIFGNYFDYGIYLELCSEGWVSNNTIEEASQRGITLYETNSTQVEKNTVINCDYGLEIWGGDNGGNFNTITYNTFTSSTGYGVIFDDTCEHNELHDNIISDSSDAGLYLTDNSAYNLIAHNDILRSGGYGVLMDLSCYNNTLFNNSILEGGDYAVHFDDVANITVALNQVENNFGGLDFNQATGLGVCGNNIHNNVFEGIYMAELLDSTIAGNNITGNQVGIQLINAANNTLWLNYVANNSALNGKDETGDNKWDNGAVGNYWGDYQTRYPLATIEDNIWSWEYEINGSGAGETYVNDTYPLASIQSDLQMSSSGDVVYGFGQVGNQIGWQLTATYPVLPVYWVTSGGEFLAFGESISGEESTLNVDGLEVGVYDYAIYGSDGTAWGTAELHIQVSVGLLPGQPVFITQSQTVTTPNITLQWSASAGADSYKVFVDGVLLQEIAATELLITFESNGTYIYTVVAVNVYGDSLPSDPITLTVEIASGGEGSDDTGIGGNPNTWVYYVVGGGVLAVAFGIGGAIFIKKKKAKKKA